MVFPGLNFKQKGSEKMININRAMGFFLLLGSIYLYTITLQWSYMEMRMLPQLILIVLGILSLVLIITGGTSVEKEPTAAEKEKHSMISSFNSKKLFFTIFLTLIYIVAINYLGFFVSTFCFLVIMYFYVYSTIYKKINFFVILIPLIMLIFLFVVFKLWLRVPVPEGVLF